MRAYDHAHAMHMYATKRGWREGLGGRRERERENENQYLSWGIDVVPAKVCCEWQHRLIIQKHTKRTLSCNICKIKKMKVAQTTNKNW